MDQQPRLIPTALDVLNVHAYYEFGEGWSARIMGRANGDTWDEATARYYDHLTTEELGDVVCAEVCRLLGL